MLLIESASLLSGSIEEKEEKVKSVTQGQSNRAEQTSRVEVKRDRSSSE